MASSHAFSIGIERVITAASIASARNQVASGRAPTSRNRSFSGTPVHSLVLVSPSISCGLMSRRRPWFWNAVPPFPEHSRKRSRDSAGNRLRSASRKVVGRSTIPWMSSS